MVFERRPFYVRREGQTEEATHDELQRIINKRIEAGYSSSSELSLKQHLEQLRLLYAEVPAPRVSFGLGAGIVRGFKDLLGPDPDAPDESFTEFIARMISEKKVAIANLLGISTHGTPGARRSVSRGRIVSK